MKNIIFSLVITLVVAVFGLSSCNKDDKTNSSVNYTVLDSEKANTKAALSLSQSFNDTLIMVYDTAKMHKNNAYCIKYDKLYHKNDSMFKAHYNMFGDEMYKNGVMMHGYTPGSMMGGGMMNGGMMDTARIHSDTTMMNGYYNNMMQLRSKHQPYHNGIYN